MSTATSLAVRERIGSARNAFTNLEQWLYSHTSATHQRHTIEVEQERRGREVLPLMLQAHIDSRGDGWVAMGLPFAQPAPPGRRIFQLRSRCETSKFRSAAGWKVMMFLTILSNMVY
jgi:hypothetical protein